MNRMKIAINNSTNKKKKKKKKKMYHTVKQVHVSCTSCVMIDHIVWETPYTSGRQERYQNVMKLSPKSQKLPPLIAPLKLEHKKISLVLQ